MAEELTGQWMGHWELRSDQEVEPHQGGLVDILVKEKKELNSRSGNQDAAALVKYCTKLPKTTKKSRRSSMSKYTPEFKADVIRFGLSHSRVVTSKKFYVPKSTVGGWALWKVCQKKLGKKNQLRN